MDKPFYGINFVEKLTSLHIEYPIVTVLFTNGRFLRSFFPRGRQFFPRENIEESHYFLQISNFANTYIYN